jgi:hypothetical protein
MYQLVMQQHHVIRQKGMLPLMELMRDFCVEQVRTLFINRLDREYSNIQYKAFYHSMIQHLLEQFHITQHAVHQKLMMRHLLHRTG